MPRYPKFRICLLGLLTILWCSASSNGQSTQSPDAKKHLATATFAGGCFWCMEPPFDGLDGVHSTTSGYTGGHTPNPTYEEVSAGTTGHAEAVQVRYDPQIISYTELLAVFWPNIDPTTADRQFCDHGNQYRTGIFYHNDEQRRLAQESKRKVEESKWFQEPVVTEITAATEFYPAEDYHQDFYQNNPLRYKLYRLACGRDARLAELWGDSHAIKQKKSD